MIRATSGASTNTSPLGVRMTIPSKICSRALSSTRSTRAQLDVVAATGPACRAEPAGDRDAVVVGHDERRAGAAVATLGRLDLALVVAAELSWPYGRSRRRVEGHEGELRDRQARVQLDRDPREVVELERQRALPARVAEARRWRGRSGRGGPSERLALDPRHDVVGELDPLHRAAEARTRRGGSRTARRPRP